METHNIYIKRFGQVTALEDINIQIRQKVNFITIMGASGPVKTTLMNILTGLDALGEGKVILDGVDASQLDEIGRRQRFGRKVGLQSSNNFHLIPLFDRTLKMWMLAQHYHSVI